MTTRVDLETRMIDGKAYSVKITRQRGLQEVELNGKPTMVEAVTIMEWPGRMGTSKTYTIAREKKTPEEEAALLAHIREVATNGLISQGIW